MPVFDTNQDTVATPNPEYLTMFRDMQLVDDLDAGTRRMRWRAESYLTREVKEGLKQYRARLLRTSLFPGLNSALDTAVAKPYSVPVSVKELPDESWESWLNNVDGEGSNLTQFMRQVQRLGTKFGIVHILSNFTNVEAATGENGQTLPTTLRDIQSIGPRPFSKAISALSLIGWEPKERADGAMGLGQIRYHEIVETTSEGSTYKKIKREFIHVIRPDEFELWENTAYNPPMYNKSQHFVDPLGDYEFYDFKNARPGQWKMVDSGPFGPQEEGKKFETVPLTTIYFQHTGFMTAKPAMMELADVNLTHYQSDSDQRNIAHVVRVPILFGAGFQQEEVAGGLTIGAGTALMSQNEGARLAYIEHSGQAMALGMDDLERLEQQMERLGIRALVERTGDMTATGAAMNTNEANTDVQAWILATQAGAKDMFAKWGAWLGLELETVEEIVVEIFSDFSAAVSDTGQRDTLLRLFQDKNITRETLLTEFTRRGLFRDGFNVEDELKALALLDAERQKKAEAIGGGFGAPKPDDDKDDDKQTGDDDDSKGGTPGGPPDDDGDDT